MSERILVVDNMSMGREVLTELLGGEFDVTVIEDGLEAVRRLEADPGGYACLLLDVDVLKTGGFAVLSHMRESGNGTPVIALMSRQDAEGRVRCSEAGVEEILEKPYDRVQLLSKVRRVTAGEHRR